MRDDLVLVLDCGSTNIRVVAVDEGGRLVAAASRPNGPVGQPGGRPEWLIWDLDGIWRKAVKTAHEVSQRVGRDAIKAVTFTTWGADGAPVSREGRPTYPPISWQCQRTKGLAEAIRKEISPWEIYKITGYQPISFNTLFKMMWLRQNVPDALDGAQVWLMMPGLLAFRLTGQYHIEPTSASTTMAMDLGRRDWSRRLLGLAGLDGGFFPKWCEPGDIVGEVTAPAGHLCNLRAGTPVIASGHDTQFALLGSGARAGEAVLSSGTWEILEVRLPRFHPDRTGFQGGMITEADAQCGLWDPQLLMMGSAVLEWIRGKFYADLRGRDYGVMIKEASQVPVGSEGAVLMPSFVSDSGPTRRFRTRGSLLGLSLHTSRAHVYRAALEGLSYQLLLALRILSAATGYEVKGLRVVGGGARNDLWNQIRADVTGLPVSVTAQREATVVGAALTAFLGIGRYGSMKEAQGSIRPEERHFRPRVNRASYRKLMRRFEELPEALRAFYRAPT
jgi:L-fuculokinase